LNKKKQKKRRKAIAIVIQRKIRKSKKTNNVIISLNQNLSQNPNQSQFSISPGVFQPISNPMPDYIALIL